jgi:hypothetical protein
MLYLFFEHIGSGTQVIIFSIVFLCFYCVYVLVFFLNTQDHRHIGSHRIGLLIFFSKWLSLYCVAVLLLCLFAFGFIFLTHRIIGT